MTRQLALSLLDQKGLPKTAENLSRAMAMLQDKNFAQEFERSSANASSEVGGADFARPSLASLRELDEQIDSQLEPTTPVDVVARNVQQSDDVPPSQQEAPVRQTQTQANVAEPTATEGLVLRDEEAAAALDADQLAASNIPDEGPSGQGDGSFIPIPPPAAKLRRAPEATPGRQNAAITQSRPNDEIIDVEFEELRQIEAPQRRLPGPQQVEAEIMQQIEAQDTASSGTQQQGDASQRNINDATTDPAKSQDPNSSAQSTSRTNLEVSRISALGLGRDGRLAVVHTPEGNVRVFDIALVDGTSRLVAPDGRVFDTSGRPTNETIDLEAAARQLGDQTVLQRIRAAAAALRGAL